MPRPFRILPSCLVVSVLIACGTPRVNVQPTPTTEKRVQVVPETAFEPLTGLNDALRFIAAGNVQKIEDAAVVIQAAKDAEARVGESGRSAQAQTSDQTAFGTRASAPAAVSIVAAGITDGVVSSVVDCIHNHESGNPTEHSHIQDGSGSNQMIPSTWRAWSSRAGLGGYAYEYLAPPAVQDEVLRFMLTHGGAGNYSMRYGNDPCTAGLPGGG